MDGKGKSEQDSKTERRKRGKMEHFKSSNRLQQCSINRVNTIQIIIQLDLQFTKHP